MLTTWAALSFAIICSATMEVMYSSRRRAETTDKLSAFYADRTLHKKKVTPKLVVKAVFLLASNCLSLTTGQSLAVDAGLPEAFLR